MRMSPLSSRIEEGTSPGARRSTLNSTELPKLKLTMSLGKFCGPNKGSLSLCQGIHDLEPAYQFKFTAVGTFPLAHQGDKKCDSAPQTNDPIPAASGRARGRRRPPSGVRRPRTRWNRNPRGRVQRKCTHRGAGRSLSTRK